MYAGAPFLAGPCTQLLSAPHKTGQHIQAGNCLGQAQLLLCLHALHKGMGPTRNMARTCVMPSLGNVCVDVCVHLGVWLTEVETCAAEGSSLIRIDASTPCEVRLQLATVVQHVHSTMCEASKGWQGSV